MAASGTGHACVSEADRGALRGCASSVRACLADAKLVAVPAGRAQNPQPEKPNLATRVRIRFKAACDVGASSGTAKGQLCHLVRFLPSCFFWIGVYHTCESLAMPIYIESG